ncbi:MAG: hypothetical protein KDA60_06400 [Planctomycetales bacterium]|nr:hypothetical protein [Planctomycetales bacterium]
MNSLWIHADHVLRARYQNDIGDSALRWPQLLVIVGVCGGGYGAMMGMFGAVGGAPSWQMIFAAMKVPLLLLGTFAVSIPSFFVMNTLAGVRRDFGEVWRALLMTQAGVAICLASLGPITLLWYCSSANYAVAVGFNGGMFLIASICAQSIMRGQYRRLISRNKRHWKLMYVWWITYAVVAIQMAWLLRPLLGNPHAAVRFFRADAFQQNAYEAVIRIIRATLW